MSLKTEPSSNDVVDTLPESPAVQNALLILLMALAGVMLTLNLAPLWLPGLKYSIVGETPKMFWFLSRGSAMAGFWILWLSMAMGIVITNKMAQIWPGIPPAYEIHQYTSILGLAFALFHALILTGDKYIGYTIPTVLVPFLGQDYRPVWVGIGQSAFYIWAVVTFSFYVRKRIGKKAWRSIHYLSYLSFLAVMLHGIFAGTDATAPLTQALYWFSGASILLLTVYRVLIERLPVENRKNKRPAGNA